MSRLSRRTESKTLSERIRVLYAEDNPNDVDMTRAEFAPLEAEFDLEFVCTGWECRERLQNREFDVLLLDNHLPDVDGADLLRELAHEGLQQPVIMVTGLGDEELVIRTLRFGASDYIAKHGDYLAQLPAVLRAVVADHRNKRTRGFSLTPRRRRILYIEHDPMDVDLTVQCLAETAPHLIVQSTPSIQEALQLLDAAHNFDLVLTDLKMVPLNALDLLREARMRGIHLPFIVITSRSDEETAVAAIKLGAYDYIIKRDNYLMQLPFAIENALARRQLDQTNDQLQAELKALNRSLEQKVRDRTEQLLYEINERQQAEIERQHLQEQLLQAQKMEGIGRLAGGIAHDFNNLLTAIMGYAELAMLTLPESDPNYANMQQIEKAAGRAADLTGQLLAFARKQVIKPRSIILNDVLLDIEDMLRRLIGEDIELIMVHGPELWAVQADPGQVQQVLVNLSVNARDAMPQGGKLIIETANVVLDLEYTRQHVNVAPGDYVLLAVSDTGIGMDEATQKRVFEPFFTTKEIDKGTGLGLATCHGIVKQSGGHIWLYSELGHGACFKIYLPRVLEAAAPAQTMSRQSQPGGLETILIAEDEEIVRAYAVQTLRSRGYQVLEAMNGREAHRLAREHAAPIHLLVTDVVMPQMYGGELAEHVRALQPEVKVLYVSGYTNAVIGQHGLPGEGAQFLQKPYTYSALLSKVREVLDKQTEA
jgi:signal transduction histidine kinase